MEKGGSEKRFPFESFSGNELPQQVFSKNNDEYLFFEFAHAFSDRAWRLFSTLAAVNNEREVLCRAAAPDANYYYQKNFGVPAEFSFSIDESAGVYVDTMHCWPASSRADALAYRAEIVWWTGTSGAWACWGGRASGLCVLRIALPTTGHSATVVPLREFVPLLSLDEALSDVVSNEMADDKLPAFESEMRRFYQ